MIDTDWEIACITRGLKWVTPLDIRICGPLLYTCTRALYTADATDRRLILFHANPI